MTLRAVELATHTLSLPGAPDAADTALRPCEVCPKSTSNVENPELYPVHPYRIYGVGRSPPLHHATNAYAARKFPGDQGWNQCAMDAAMLGLAAEAAKLVLARAQTGPAAGYRFPIFAPHEQAPAGDE